MPNKALTATADELLIQALEAGGDPAKTGRYLVTYKEGALDAGLKSLSKEHGLKVANARDTDNQAMALDAAGDADALVFPEIGVAVLSSEAAESRSLMDSMGIAADSPILSVDPEYFMFANQVNVADYLKGVIHTAQTIYDDIGMSEEEVKEAASPEVLGATWGIAAVRASISQYSGNDLKVAVLDTGFDLGHPDFVGRTFVTASFVGQPVQDLHGHGTHTCGTANGPKAPAGFIPRYGIAYRDRIYVGKVLSNSGAGTQAQVLAGMNWAIANRCVVISMSLGGGTAVQPSYTAAGQAALNAGCLIVAAAGNDSARPGRINPAIAPANSPTVVSVAALDSALHVAPFSNGGKVDIAAPGVSVYSAAPRPTLHTTMSGTSMATPHVAGCAALWAETNPNLRGAALRTKLFATARHLPYPASDVGAGLVQAPFRQLRPFEE